MFRTLTETMMVAPQIDTAAVAEAAALGVRLIINNRPEDESPDQTPGEEIAAAARAAGIDYVAIPVTHAGFSMPQIEAMTAALARTGGPVLAYCRSGTRSCLLWSLAQARQGADVDWLSHTAAGAGYDLGPIRQTLDMLRAQA